MAADIKDKDSNLKGGVKRLLSLSYFGGKNECFDNVNGWAFIPVWRILALAEKLKSLTQKDHMEGRAPSRPNILCGHDRAWPSRIQSCNPTPVGAASAAKHILAPVISKERID